MILRSLFAFLACTSSTLFFTPLHKMSSDYFSLFLKIFSSHSSFSKLHLSTSNNICAAVMFTPVLATWVCDFKPLFLLLRPSAKDQN